MSISRLLFISISLIQNTNNFNHYYHCFIDILIANVSLNKIYIHCEKYNFVFLFEYKELIGKPMGKIYQFPFI